MGSPRTSTLLAVAIPVIVLSIMSFPADVSQGRSFLMPDAFLWRMCCGFLYSPHRCLAKLKVEKAALKKRLTEASFASSSSRTRALPVGASNGTPPA